MISSESDQELIRRFRGGDPSAFTVLIERYQSRVQSLARRVLKSQAEAEEVGQEVSLIVYQKLGQYEGKAAFSTWLYRVALNAALMRRRSRRPEFAILPEDGELEPREEETGEDPDERLITEESLAQIESALAYLPEELQTALILRDVEGFSTEETAQILELSVPAVKSRLHRGRMVLRKKLAGLYRETVKE